MLKATWGASDMDEGARTSRKLFGVDPLSPFAVSATADMDTATSFMTIAWLCFLTTYTCFERF